MSVQLELSRKKVSELQLRIDSFSRDRQLEDRELTQMREDNGRYKLTIEKITRELTDARRHSAVDVRRKHCCITNTVHLLVTGTLSLDQANRGSVSSDVLQHEKVKAELAMCQQRVKELEAAMRKGDSDSSVVVSLRRELDDYKLRVLQISSEVPYRQ